VDLGRDLAVKVLLAKYANRPEVARRFIEEAQIGGQLQHPGVVPVYDIGRFGDRPFFTMKLVKGKTLAALLSESPVGHVCNVPDEEARCKRAPQELAREVNDAVGKSTALREKAKTALTGSEAVFAQAREQAQRALALVESGPADAALKDQVAQLQRELDEEDKHHQLLAALNRASMAQTDQAAGYRVYWTYAWESSVPLFREAFRAYGLPAGEGEATEAAALLRRKPGPVREAMLAALDEWIDLATDAPNQIRDPHLDWLRTLAEAAEPNDGWTRRLQAAVSIADTARRRTALEKLADESNERKLPARALRRLARRLRLLGAPASAAALLRRAWQHHPADFWINHELHCALLDVKPPQHDESIRYASVTVALRPDSPPAHSNLGLALADRGRIDEAIACYHKAITLDPKNSYVHTNLALALSARGKVHDAIECFHKAIQFNPKNAKAHLNLGAVLKGSGQVDEAIACYKQAIAIDPRYAMAHSNLGLALSARGQFDEASACFRKAIELLPAGHRMQPSLSQRVRTCERVLKLQTRLPLFLRGEDKPGSAREGFDLAMICRTRRMYASAVRFAADALAADPKLAGDLRAGHRYKAACAAVLTAASHGTGEARLDEKERIRLRQQALNWLHADLRAWTKLLASGQRGVLSAAQQTLRHWQKDSDLAGVREPAPLAGLAEEERAAWVKLWSDVSEMLKKAESSSTKEPQR
jgi:tetratricopeptide (TPR) repeat protein